MATAPKCPGCQRTEVGFAFAPIHSERDGHLLIVYCGQCGYAVGCAWRPTVQHLEEKAFDLYR
jgi:hypothetical protein